MRRASDKRDNLEALSRRRPKGEMDDAEQDGPEADIYGELAGAYHIDTGVALLLVAGLKCSYAIGLISRKDVYAKSTSCRSLGALPCMPYLLPVRCVYSVMVSAFEKGVRRDLDQGFTWCCFYKVFNDAAPSTGSSASPSNLASSRRSSTAILSFSCKCVSLPAREPRHCHSIRLFLQHGILLHRFCFSARNTSRHLIRAFAHDSAAHILSHRLKLHQIIFDIKLSCRAAGSNFFPLCKRHHVIHFFKAQF